MYLVCVMLDLRLNVKDPLFYRSNDLSDLMSLDPLKTLVWVICTHSKRYLIIPKKPRLNIVRKNACRQKESNEVIR